jgi:hypothetical protein
MTTEHVVSGPQHPVQVPPVQVEPLLGELHEVGSVLVVLQLHPQGDIGELGPGLEELLQVPPEVLLPETKVLIVEVLGIQVVGEAHRHPLLVTPSGKVLEGRCLIVYVMGSEGVDMEVVVQGAHAGGKGPTDDKPCAIQAFLTDLCVPIR